MDKQVNEQQLIDLGAESETLLQTPVFNSTINGLVEACFQAFINTKPEQEAEREKTYHHYRALVDIISTLKQRVEVKNNIEKEREENQSDKRKKNEE
tara:strand:+ start:67 stop:357 length:291 start_codon:yes stop_codon:yes gene_type:complete